MYSTWALNNLNQPKPKGFTIVELLIVIVVIAILAAITVVAYNGISNNSKTSAAKAAASSAAKKAGAYHAETGAYPVTSATLTSAASSTSYYLSGVTFGTPAANADPSTLVFRKCGSGSPTTQSAITASNLTGVQIVHWDYTNGNANLFAPIGTVSGTGIACPSAA